MKHLLLGIFTLVLLLESTSFSQVDSLQPEPVGPPPDREIFLQGGISVPYLPKDFNSYWKNGANLGVGFGLSFAPGELGYATLRLMVEYNGLPLDFKGYRAALLERFPADSAVINAGSLAKYGRAKIYTAMIDLKGSFSSTKKTFAPYFLLGVGYFHLSADSIGLAGTSKYNVNREKLSGFAWSAGLGIEMPITDRIGIYAQGKVVIGVSDRTRQHFPISGGVKITM